MKQTQRIIYLHSLLSSSKLTYQTLLEELKKKNVVIGHRQLQRDIKDLQLFLSENELLVKNRGKGNILELTINKRAHVIRQTFSEASVFKTPIYKKDNKKKILFFENATSKKTSIRIDELKNDATSFNTDFKDTSFTIIPLKLIYHNYDYYLGCYTLKTKEFKIFEINQLTKYHALTSQEAHHFNQLITDFTSYTKTLFGVTKNIDDNIYRIKLEFSSVTGAYVEQFIWHHTQKFKREDNSVMLTMKCGINRELLGWIFMWMYNVRIIEPPELKDYYDKTIKHIEQINTDEMLLYKNIFV